MTLIYCVELIYDNKKANRVRQNQFTVRRNNYDLKRFSFYILAQFCAGGTVTFDKITRVDLRNTNPIPLFSSRGNTVTAECNNR